MDSKTKTVKCSEVIKTCKYRGRVGIDEICDYLETVGHSRGCHPECCDKYEKKEGNEKCHKVNTRPVIAR